MNRLTLVLWVLGSLSALSQTALDLNEGLRIQAVSSAPGVHELSWFGKDGRAYFLLQSNDDMESWVHVPMLEAGTDDVITWGLHSNAARTFFKLQHVDDYPIGAAGQTDTDADGVADLDELLAGTNPFDAPVPEPPPLDSDEDGRDDTADMVPYDPGFKGPCSMSPGGYAVVDLGVGNEAKLGSGGHAYWRVSSTRKSWPNANGQVLSFTSAQLQGILGLFPGQYGDISPSGVIAGTAGDSQGKSHTFTYVPGGSGIVHGPFDFVNGSLGRIQWGPGNAVVGTFSWGQNNSTQYPQGIFRHSGSYEVIRSVQRWEIPELAPEPDLDPGQSEDVYAGEFVSRYLAPSNGGSSGWIEDLWESRSDAYDRYEDNFASTEWVQRLLYPTVDQRTLSLRTSAGASIPLLTRDLLTQADATFTSVSAHLPLPWLSGPSPTPYPLWMGGSPMDHLWIPENGSYTAVPIFANAAQYEDGPSLEHIHQVNGQGMAVVRGIMQDNSDHIGVWANGMATPLSGLISESIWQRYNPGIYLWSMKGFSDQGMILAEARKLSDNATHVLALIPGEAVVRDATTTEVTSGWLATEVRPKPEVKMYITGAQMTSGGVQVSVRGTVYDELSGLALNSGDRVSQLQFSVFGQALGSINLSSAVGSGQLFNHTLVIPYAQATGYVIRAETSPNKAGETGWDEVAVSVGYTGGTVTSGASLQMHVLFSATPDASTVDTAVVYFGGSAPASGGVVTETGPDTGVFTGTAIHPEGEVPCTIRLDLPEELQAGQADMLSASAAITLASGPTRVTTSLQETGADTKVFTIPNNTPVFDAGPLQVAATANLNGPAAEKGLKPFTIRMGAPEAVATGGAQLSINGTAFDLASFQDGDRHFLYPVDPAHPGVPRQFLAATGPVPSHLSIPGYESTGETQSLDFRLICLGQETTVATVQVEPGSSPLTEDEEPPPQNEGGNEERWKKPGDKITHEDLMTAFALLYGNEGQDLLYYFEEGGGVIQLGDYWDDLDLDVWTFDQVTYIQIEEDDAEVAGTQYHPGVAAQLLWIGLNQSLAYHHIRTHIPVTELNNLIASRQAVAQQACQTGIAAAELYLAAIGVANEGADLVLTINDVVEGHYESLGGALPFIPASVFRNSGKIWFKNQLGQTMGMIRNADELAAIKDLYRIVDPQVRLNAVGTVLEANDLSIAIAKMLNAGNGPVPVPTWRGQLSERMEKLVPRPSATHVAHHELIWGERIWFAEHGLDVNDVAFGRWVPEDVHKRWHYWTEPTKYNQFWKDFINRERTLPARYTKQEILDKLTEARSIFTVSEP